MLNKDKRYKEVGDFVHPLKHELIEIRKNGYDFTGYNLDDLSLNMIKDIGTTDEELRDELIYTTFEEMIIEKNQLDEPQLKRLLKACLDDEHLFHGLGKKESDTVFARAFSVLVVGLILYADRHHSFLSKSKFGFVKDKLFTYVTNEVDVRGYVEGKGWAHALAHTADALDEVAKHPYSTEHDLEELLNIIQSTFLTSETVYSHNEDERMALPVITIFKSGLLKDRKLLNWIGDFELLLKEHTKCVSDPKGLNLYENVRHFLYSLYFRLRFEQMGIPYQRKIEDILYTIRVF